MVSSKSFISAHQRKLKKKKVLNFKMNGLFCCCLFYYHHCYCIQILQDLIYVLISVLYNHNNYVNNVILHSELYYFTVRNCCCT